LAVAVVAQAVLSMARSLCPDRARALIAVAALAAALMAPTGAAQIAAIIIGATAGVWICRSDAQTVPEPFGVPLGQAQGALAFCLFAILLALAFVPFGASPLWLFNAFYRSGALVFGGGHVVLPLLNQAIVKPGWVSNTSFLAGYGAAQAVPGPLFTFATFLGATARPPLGGAFGALLATIAIFLPGMLLQLTALPYWNAFRRHPRAQAAMRGINASVVGVLGASLYTPVWTSAVLGPVDFALAAAGFVLLMAWKVQPILVAAGLAAAGILRVLL
jgi:chromate transporter